MFRNLFKLYLNSSYIFLDLIIMCLECEKYKNVFFLSIDK